MSTITINGKKKDREFQNMAYALAFVCQNGECHNAEKIEIAYAAKKTGDKPEEASGIPAVTKPKANNGGKPSGSADGKTKTGEITSAQANRFDESTLIALPVEELERIYKDITKKEVGPGVNTAFMIQSIIRVQAENKPV